MGRRRYVTVPFPLSPIETKGLYTKISSLFQQTQEHTFQKSNSRVFILYWKIGRIIAEYIYTNNIKDEDYQKFLSQLSEPLIKKFGKDFKPFTLAECYKFHFTYPSFFKQKAQHKNTEVLQFPAVLSWDHYRILIYVGCPEARNFYENKAYNSNWSSDSLEQFINSHLFERLSISENKESVLRAVQQRR
ncbi:MAG: hypothetical protein K2P93_05075 [Alphaproteobacteria bacterium]|nr:hypothetical protein [Alphaproteobacteria bacterium]